MRNLGISITLKRALFSTLLLAALAASHAQAASVQPRYYAHDTVEDANGVIAPWYTGLNGQWDHRIHIAAETLKRYPWTSPDTPAHAVPHYVFNGTWGIAPDGVISIPELRDWDNGDLGQRAAYVLAAWVDYYRYSGDAAAIGHMAMMADTLLESCQTPDTHPWPHFLVSVPTKGKPYAQCDPNGHIQLDIVAETGLALVRAYECVGDTRWLEAAKHWADLLAQNRSRIPGTPPWGRYANPEAVQWEDPMTGGIAFLLAFFDELIQIGYTGEGNELVAARDDGRTWLRDELLPKWTVDETWGRNYWDWNDPVQAENVTEFVVRYLIEHQEIFPNWRNDARNILSLFLNRTGVCPGSAGDVYSGAWAYPESSSCCGRSLWYGPLELAPVWAQYGARAASPWATEIARRQAILATYDALDTGVVEDGIDGGPVVAGGWFKIAHPMALKHVLNAIATMPEFCGANRENHLLSSASTVRNIIYGKGAIAYTAFDARADAPDRLRLAFTPDTVTADGAPLPLVQHLESNGYTATQLPNGDCLVEILHAGSTNMVISGEDPQTEIEDDALTYQGAWIAENGFHTATGTGAEATLLFSGNQVRVLGQFAPNGGKADVWLDGVLQPAGMDCWMPGPSRTGQVLYGKSGLPEGSHTLKIAARGEGNPRSTGTAIYLDKVQYSSAAGDAGTGAGNGPTETQRMIFGYPAREDYTDSTGKTWRPATEWIARTGSGTDVVNTAWWTARKRFSIENTPDPELYRYGVHAPEFWVNITVAPGQYHVRLKFAEIRNGAPSARAVTIAINGNVMAKDLDIAATAGGMNRAVDLVFNEIAPVHGVIEVRLSNPSGGEAILQALEAGPGDGGAGAAPVSLAIPDNIDSPPQRGLLVNPGFEDGVVGALGALGAPAVSTGWNILFASPAQCYVWAESAYSIHPDWGLPIIHGGKEAIRTHTEGRGHTVIYQDVTVTPATKYRASVWVQTIDLNGMGFGANPGDSAGLWIQELDTAGRNVSDRPKRDITQAGPYQEIAETFTTSPATVKVRFVLDTVIVGRYDQGHVSYDDCTLEKITE